MLRATPLRVGLRPLRAFADAILDRLVHNAYRVELEGQSMRKTKLKTGDESAQN
jgi:DNA replication protein DnaC